MKCQWQLSNLHAIECIHFFIIDMIVPDEIAFFKQNPLNVLIQVICLFELPNMEKNLLSGFPISISNELLC